VFANEYLYKLDYMRIVDNMREILGNNIKLSQKDYDNFIIKIEHNTSSLM